MVKSQPLIMALPHGSGVNYLTMIGRSLMGSRAVWCRPAVALAGALIAIGLLPQYPTPQAYAANTSSPVSPQRQEPACGDIITKSVTLTRDLTCTATTGLTIAASDVVLDLGGHILSTTDPGQVRSALAIAGRRTLNRITVQNGTIRSDGFALSLTDTNSVSITNVHLRGGQPVNDLTTAAIVTDRARDLHIAGGSISGYNETSGGAAFDNQTTVTISGSNFSATKVLCGGASTCTIETSTIRFFRIDCGPSPASSSLIMRNNTSVSVFEIGRSFSDCGSATISDNSAVDLFDLHVGALTISGNTINGPMGGFTIDYRGSYQISGNTFSFPGVGRLLILGGRGTVTGNTFNGSPYCGLHLNAVTTITGPIVISENTFTNNGHSSAGGSCSPGDGLQIHANPGANITVSKNHTENNAVYGIRVASGTVIDGGGNTSVGDPSGCLGVTCS
jgi:hypothetical protein